MNLANLDLSMGEVAPMETRGPALYMYQFLQSCSELVASGVTQGCNSLNTSLGYRLPMGGLIILPLAMFLWLPFIPESPTWYVFAERLKAPPNRYARPIVPKPVTIRRPTLRFWSRRRSKKNRRVRLRGSRCYSTRLSARNSSGRRVVCTHSRSVVSSSFTTTALSLRRN